MKYSFVLPAYKAHYLKEAIESILNQTYTDFELVVVDDASPQNLSAIVGQFNDPRLKFYTNKENIGGKVLDIDLGNDFWDLTLKTQPIKTRISRWDYISN